ncbi:hypothetical protein NKH77_38805 [Streptomyces sp. M19]
MAAEVIRRIDGRRIDRFFAEEIAGPLGLDISYGVPPEQEHRVARLEYGRTSSSSTPGSSPATTP